ncbi:Protein of unknown function [Poseidonocella pacifica]|uniref:DUF3987 domain-containing protein n=1 Tax=Poseidonocella pacifica TaxID=871651 RepID=A0A1I0YRA3_9RHOB|nr:DUF3987 domain-containing protein [Poseidonocella pacifica]SFB15905.1 Protein of unknown function [Poseidonocella pacifica]
MNKILTQNDLLPIKGLLEGGDCAVQSLATVRDWQAEPIALGGASGCTDDFPLHALGCKGSKAAAAIRESSQAPRGLCGQAVLCAMSTSVSSWGQVEAIHGNATPMALFLITVAQSGERKTAVDGAAQLGIKAFEKQLEKTLQERRSLDRDSKETQCGDEAVSEIVVGDPTYEGLLGNMARGPGVACLSNDDAAGFFGGHSMGRDQRQKTIAGLSQIWSGSDIKRPRAHGRDTSVSGVPLTMSLMFQPYLIGQVYGDREMVEQGILPRVLPCFPKSTMGTRFFKASAREAQEVVRSFAESVLATLHEVRALKALRVPVEDPFAPPCAVLPLSQSARRVLVDFYNEIEAELGDGGKFEKTRGFASRSIENATRIAAVVTLFDDTGAAEVTEAAARSSCDLMRFYLAEFSALLRLGRSERDDSEAGQLGAWLAGRYGAGGYGHDKDISQFGPPAFRKKADRQVALQRLVSQHWIRMLPPGAVVDGTKRAEAFQVHPNIDRVL